MTEVETIYRDLKNQFMIKDNSLINQKGDVYPRLLFKDKLHSDLAYMLKDPQVTQAIYDAYEKHIHPLLSNSPSSPEKKNTGHEDYLYLLKEPQFAKFFEETNYQIANQKQAKTPEEAFSKALLDVCHLFGSENPSVKQALLISLYQQGPVGMKWAHDNDSSLTQFVLAANLPLYPKLHQHEKGPFKVLVLTTSASGGNHAVAKAIVSFLSSFKNITPILLDSETVAKSIEPMMLATCTNTYDSLYANTYQKTHDFNAIFLRESLNREIHDYIPSRLIQGLKEVILQIKPDIILSTRSYVSDDIALANLGLPFRMIHCDFSLSLFLNSLYGKVDPETIRFWIPHNRPSMFRPLFEWYDRLDLFNPDDTYDILLKKISSFTFVSEDILRSQFEVLGYPTEPEFFPIYDDNEIQALRKKWNILEHEIPIFFAMGKYGTGHLSKMLKSLLSSPSNLPLKYLFISGKNPSIKRTLDTLLLEAPDKGGQFAIYGYLTPQEMNELMNICSMGVSKAGGATIAEAIKTHTHLLILKPHPWEEVNAKELENMNLARRGNDDEPLLPQIEAYVNSLPQKRGSLPKLASWEIHLISYLEKALGTRLTEGERLYSNELKI